jgi:hypothetical protein
VEKEMTDDPVFLYLNENKENFLCIKPSDIYLALKDPFYPRPHYFKAMLAWVEENGTRNEGRGNT